MGKTIKGKNKTAAKKATLVKKIARKCKRATASAVVAIVAAILAGCAQTGPQPARSQSQTFHHCIFIAAAKATATEGRVQAEGGELPTLEIGTQTQANEGSETVSPTATPTTDTKPDIDVSIPVKGSSGTTAGALETLIGAGAGKLSQAINGKAQEAPVAAPGACSDGSCAYGTCSDGSCNP